MTTTTTRKAYSDLNWMSTHSLMTYDGETYTHNEALDAVEQLAADTNREGDLDGLMSCDLRPVATSFNRLMTWTPEMGCSLEDYVIPRV